MTPFVFAIPGDLDAPTGGYAYDRRVLAELEELGLPVHYLKLPGSFPLATVPDLGEAGYLLKTTPDDAVIMVDGLAFGALTDLVLKDIERTFVALVHHPLAAETGLPERRRRAFHASEASALARAAHVIVTSPSTAIMLVADYGVPREKITIAEPGTDPSERATGSGSAGDTVQLLCVGSVLPRKGYRVLVEALAGLPGPWSCTIVGATDRDGEEADAVRAAIADAGLADRVHLAGATSEDELAGYYHAADVFVMPSLFEGYGMALAEAMARGLPVVCTTGGAMADTAPDAAAIKVPPGDVASLRAALARMISDPELRGRLSDASWAAGTALPRWTDTAELIAGALREVALRREPSPA